MPGRPGMRIQQPGITPAQTQFLNTLVDDEGMGEGIKALYYRVRKAMGNAAPTRDEIQNYLNPKPHYQIARQVKKNRIK